MKSSDMKKQKEFFEKKKMEKRRSLLAPPPPSPKGNNVGNMDLLTMFIVNQIALKKEHTGKPVITRLPDSKVTHKSMCMKPLELPMSPCSPSRLSLAHSDPQYSDETRKGKLVDGFRLKMLSPLLETSLSENSSSECQNRAQDSASSFSSSSHGSSNTVNLQSGPTALLSCPTQSESYYTNTSQPLELCDDDDLWAAMHLQTHPPTTNLGDQAQFGSILQSTTETTGQSINTTGYPLNTSQNEEQEEPLFLGFTSDELGDKGVFSKRTRKITLQGEVLTSPTKAHELCSRDSDTEFLPPFSQGVESEQLMISGASCVHSYMFADTPIAALCSPDRRVLSFRHNVTSTPVMGVESKTIRHQWTQTAHTSQDASVQCRLLTELGSVIHREGTRNTPATRRQTGHTSKRPHASPDGLELKRNAPTRERTPTRIGRESSRKADSQARMKKALRHAHTNAADLNEQLKEHVLVVDHETSMMQNHGAAPSQPEEHSGGFLAGRAEEETGALQEIADILLMMKQKNKPA